MSARRQSIRDGLEHLLRLPDDEREGWLDRRQTAVPDTVNWWLYLLILIENGIRDRSDRNSEWIDLKLWLLERGHAASSPATGRTCCAPERRDG